MDGVWLVMLGLPFLACVLAVACLWIAGRAGQAGASAGRLLSHPRGDAGRGRSDGRAPARGSGLTLHLPRAKS